MNLAASTTSLSSTSDVSSTSTQSKTSGNQKTSEKSFDEEMKTASKTEETKNSDTEKASKENKTPDKNSKEITNKDKEDDKISEEFVSAEMLSGDINFTDFKYHNTNQSILSQNIQNLLNTKDIMNTVSTAMTIDYDSINMSDNDANFFANLVQNTDMSMKGIMDQLNGQLVENSGNVQKSIQVSSVLMEKLADSLRTNQPFRIDFDKDVSVIIKVNKDGSLSANFIPGDKAVEQYLRNNIASLKQRFDDENLSYSELTYSNHRENKQRNKKENNNE